MAMTCPDCKELREALEAATRSLEALTNTKEFDDLWDVRAYAMSRAGVARAALSKPQREEGAHEIRPGVFVDNAVPSTFLQVDAQRTFTREEVERAIEVAGDGDHPARVWLTEFRAALFGGEE